MLNESKTIKQEEEVEKFINHIKEGNVGAAMEACTGFGKTRMALMAIQRFNKHKLVHVVVPTIALKNQWEEIIKNQLFGYSVQVYVINTYVSIARECSFLIVDEGHRISNEDAKIFNTVIDNCDFQYSLILSATFTKEQLDFLTQKGIKLITKISLVEAVKNKWVSPCKYYNLEIDLLPAEREEYDKLSNIIKAHFPYFEGDLKLVYNIMSNKLLLNNYAETNGFDPRDLGMRAARLTQSIAKRKAILANSIVKKKACYELSQYFNNNERKTIVFSQTKKFINELKKDIPGSLIYHSDLTDNDKEKVLQKVIDNECKTLLTVKSLNEGLDIPSLNTGICAAYTSVERDLIQQAGRIGRFEEGKLAIYVTLVFKNSIEEGYVKKRMKSIPNVIRINNVNEIEL